MPGGSSFGKDFGKGVDSAVTFKDPHIKSGMGQFFQFDKVAQLILCVGFERGQRLTDDMTSGGFHTAGAAAETEDLSISVNHLMRCPGTDKTLGTAEFALKILIFQQISVFRSLKVNDAELFHHVAGGEFDPVVVGVLSFERTQTGKVGVDPLLACRSHGAAGDFDFSAPAFPGGE